MHSLNVSYSIAVFVLVLISASILNLLKQHFIFQITGIAFLFMFMIVKISILFKEDLNILLVDLYYTVLPILTAIGACLVSMALGFWIFPPIRKILRIKKDL